ncbi:hypothetical protein D3C84_1224940 [compost metagenome]
MAYQRVGQRLKVAWSWDDTLFVKGPGRGDHHRQARVDVQVRVQRLQGRLQCMGGDLPDRGTGHQLGKQGVLIG